MAAFLHCPVLLILKVRQKIQLRSALDHGIPIDIILIDLFKAFDQITLRKLIHCLEVYGIKGQVKNWLSAYLNDRKIAVKVSDTLSAWIDATNGVPQGSVLGPVLFVMYINICINTISQTDFGLFADDKKILGEASASSQIQSDLKALTEKLEKWLLSPNAAKCSVVHLGRQNPKYPYKMKGNSELVPQTRKAYQPGSAKSIKYSLATHSLPTIP
ncbi:hypothetical protein QYM36_011522 [Artemia franciscana]|uniref:Reverse transcriptase domain-containing protein n=1 Tax=Artemia franciscana TaxID=6661 RepID=A0AA88HS16_ARTSF|nr:hypothetical protein QYM36_011522 [Artemia franciscana]